MAENEEEEWRAVNERPDLYEVSSFGRVKNAKTKRILSQTDHSGYLAVGLSINGKTPTRAVHQLVAKAFIENPESKGQINHKDKNKQNNHVANLEWCTQEENCQHRSAGVIQSSNQTLKTFMKNTVTGEVLKTFNSIKEAAEWIVSEGLATKVTNAQSRIGYCTRGVTKETFGYNWDIDKGTNKPGEEWRNVVIDNKVIENYYISNLGRFKNTKGVIMDGYQPHGSSDINVCVNSDKYPIHHLVAFAFVPNPDNKPNVIHINGDKLDNRAENLKWMSPAEYCLENRATGRNPGFKRAVAVFDLEMNELKRFKTMKEVSTEFNVSYSCVKEALKENKPTKGLLIKYLDGIEEDNEVIEENEVIVENKIIEEENEVIEEEN